MRVQRSLVGVRLGRGVLFVRDGFGIGGTVYFFGQFFRVVFKSKRVGRGKVSGFGGFRFFFLVQQEISGVVYFRLFVNSGFFCRVFEQGFGLVELYFSGSFRGGGWRNVSGGDGRIGVVLSIGFGIVNFCLSLRLFFSFFGCVFLVQLSGKFFRFLIFCLFSFG